MLSGRCDNKFTLVVPSLVDTSQSALKHNVFITFNYSEANCFSDKNPGNRQLISSNLRNIYKKERWAIPLSKSVKAKITMP